jgi:hypothetical protein
MYHAVFQTRMQALRWIVKIDHRRKADEIKRQLTC